MTETIDQQPEPKIYLADSIYARVELSADPRYDEIILTSENGVKVLNRVVMERSILEFLVHWTENLRRD